MSSHIRLCLLVVLFSFLLAPLSAAGSGRVLFPHACSREAGTGSRSHERALDRLNGRRIVFVGDSVSRYQYLELAYFAIYGVCPDQKAAPEYILSAYSAGFHEETRWPSFYNSSTSQLNFKGDVRWSKETCFCARTDLAPGKVFENRAFEYQDSEVRCLQEMEVTEQQHLSISTGARLWLVFFVDPKGCTQMTRRVLSSCAFVFLSAVFALLTTPSSI